MFNQDKDTKDSNNKKSILQPRGQKNNSNNFNILSIIFIILLIALFTFLGTQMEVLKPTKRENISQLFTELREGKVASIKLSEDKTSIEAQIYKSKGESGKDCNRDPNNLEKKIYKTDGIDATVQYIPTILAERGSSDNYKVTFGTKDCDVNYTQEPTSFWTELSRSGILNTLLFVGIIVFLGMFLLKRLGDVNSKSISFGNSRAKSFEDIEGDKKITFDDVAGNKEAKEELTQIVDFLKRPQVYLDMGAKIPKGALLVGSPGNGKTLLAKAVAGEAGVPFMFVSGSEFAEMFVGVGASRVRDLFKQARKSAPCIIFIDEIDAVGKKRGGIRTGNDSEAEQTLNQILVEMDGFEKSDSIIILAATNRPDVLDPALLRPGRFDRQVTVTSPDRKERLQILEVHSKNKRISKNIDLEIIAKRTPGFSGADLANLMNEATIMAVTNNKKLVDDECLREAIEKVALGPALKSKIQTDETRELTAYHEAGHALLASVVPNANKVQKVTIVPRGRAGGYTFNSSDDNTIVRQSKLLAEIQVLFGGYVVEQIFFKDLSTGASNDLERASQIARDMVTKYGMSALGPRSFSEGSSMTYSNFGQAESDNHSEVYAKLIDDEVSKILSNCYNEAVANINKYRSQIKAIATKLLENETLELEEFNQILGSDIKQPELVKPLN
jgi:cell division protease FtsH